MKKLSILFAGLATIGLVHFAAPTADAAGFGLYLSNGRTYPSYYVGRPAYVGYGYGYDTYYGDDCVEDIHHDDLWHDTSHLHYRPARIVPHGDHLHYVPGRLELHRTGHWHHVHW